MQHILFCPFTIILFILFLSIFNVSYVEKINIYMAMKRKSHIQPKWEITVCPLS